MNSNPNTNGAARYLNAILTINAVLLGLLLWTQVAGTPMFDRTAEAQATRTEGQDSFANPIKQRKQMIDLLKSTNDSINKLTQSIEKSTVNVKVTNFDEMETGDDD